MAAAHTTEVLLARVRAGDAVARADLIARVEPLLRRFAHGRLPSLLRHEHDTADLVQSTWLNVLQRLEHIHTERAGDFFAYLRTALVNGMRQALRREQRQSAVVGRADDAVIESVPAEHVDPADWLTYEQALAQLPEGPRTLVQMRFEFGMSFVEIGAELGETGTAVRLRLARAVARMMDVVQDERAAD
jgi:RNA polymerase sigma factor (sigma-70 family)